MDHNPVRYNRISPSLGKIQTPSFNRIGLGAEALLGPLCDLQGITGAAILIAGFSQWRSITYYHREVVLSYFWLILNSYWMGRTAYMYDAVRKTDKTNAADVDANIMSDAKGLKGE